MNNRVTKCRQLNPILGDRRVKSSVSVIGIIITLSQISVKFSAFFIDSNTFVACIIIFFHCYIVWCLLMLYCGNFPIEMLLAVLNLAIWCTHALL